MKHIVLGTAGHIDHGKTLLTKALTGVDTDRLEEEKERGITIELGFAPMKLSDGNKISIVDVPGHERFVRTMMAGASGIDAVLFVVAADDGVMPQSAEHMDIISLLRVKSGIVVITKCDLADEKRLQEVHKDIEKLVSGTCLQYAPVCEVSAVTGEGIPDLKSKIEELVSRLNERSIDRPFRLCADRVFPVSGFGQVVTGTLTEGELHVGDNAQIYPGNALCSVRSLQNHNKSEDVAFAGSRTAMSFSGLHNTAPKRGDTIAAPGSMIVTDRLNVYIQITPDCPYKIKNSSQLHLFHGTKEVLCKLRLLDADVLIAREGGYAQLNLSEPIAVRMDDRFILRFFSPVITIGGGTVLSCGGKRLRRNNEEVLGSLKNMNSEDAAVKLSERVKACGIIPVSREEMRLTSNLSEKEYKEAEDEAFSRNLLTPMEKNTLLANSIIKDRLQRATDELRKFHEEYPLQAGEPVSQFRKQVFPEDGAPGDELTNTWISQNAVKSADGFISLPDFKPVFTQEHKIMQRKIQHFYRDAWMMPPDTRDTDKKFEKRGPIYKQVLKNMILNGMLISIAPNYLMHAEAYDEALNIFTGLCLENEGKTTLGELRTKADISRKYSQMFLEYWDSHGISRRVGDEHMLFSVSISSLH